MPTEKSAGVIVFYVENNKEIKFLFLRHIDSWDFPKGLIEKGEKPEEAALRECREETRLKIKELMPGFKETIRFFFKVKYDYQLDRGLKMGQTILKFVTYFLAQSDTKDVNVSFEHKGYEWLAYEEAMGNLKKRKSNQGVLKKAYNYIKKPAN